MSICVTQRIVSCDYWAIFRWGRSRKPSPIGDRRAPWSPGICEPPREKDTMRTDLVDMPLALDPQPLRKAGGGPVAPSLRVAIVDEELPYPLNSGKRIRTLNLLKRLATRHRITYICHRNADLDEARRAETYLRDLGIEPIVVERAVPRKSGLGFYARLTANLFS